MARPDTLSTLAAIVDTFAPGGDGLPSASELGVHIALLDEVKALGRSDLEGQLRLLLSAFETAPGALLIGGKAKGFSAQAQADREAFLLRLATSSIGLKRTAFQDLKRLTFLLLYGMAGPYRDLTGFREQPGATPSPSRLTVRTPEAGAVLDADAVVIGSGAGGGVAAAHLAAAGLKVIVLERAAEVSEHEFGGPELDGLRALFLDRGLTATSDRAIAIRAGSAVGGGTVVNWNTSLRAPAAVREEWAAAGIGAELDGHYDAISTALKVTSDESARNHPNAMLEKGLRALNLAVQTIPRNVSGCGDCGPCAVGCRSGAKQSVRRTYLAEACALGAEILDRSLVERIVVEQGRVRAVVARVPGGEVTIRTPRVALAAGSLHSPAVLIRSGLGEGRAGRFLHLHPVVGVVGEYTEPLEPWSGIPQSVMSDSFAEIDGAWGYRVEAAPTHPGLIATGYPWASPAQHTAAMRKADRLAAFVAIVRDRSVGRVDVKRGGHVVISYRPGLAERRLLSRAGVDLAAIHRAAGAVGLTALTTPPIALGPDDPFDPFLERLRRHPLEPNRTLLFTAHQLSSNRIGQDRRGSVANPDGQVWDVEGLYITDASALPTASGVNPMLSIMALARRTALRMGGAPLPSEPGGEAPAAR